MSIRSEAMPYRGNLSNQLEDTLRRNGMRAQLAVEGDKYMLLVQGHDSPMLSYPISEQQFRALADGGTNYANKKAYNTFNGIVGKDFDMPSSYVAAKNVNGRVVMGLHGARESHPDRGMGMPMRPHAFGRDFLGWTSRQQPGMHLRRIGGVAVMAEPMLMEHTDGRIRPGELKPGGYGYYYKGQQSQQAVTVDPLKDLQTYFPPVETRPRPAEPAIPYKEHITSDVYFTNEKWQEVLKSHGIIIDADKKQLTIQSTATQQDFVYDLSDTELKKLTDNSLKTSKLQDRLDILNNVISIDFKDTITKDMLNSKDRIGISLKPEVEQTLNAQQAMQQSQMTVIPDPLAQEHHDAPTLNPDEGYVDGSRIEDLNERKGWYREGKHGREVDVGDIWVEKVQPQPKDNAEAEQQKGKKDDDKVTYKMSAVINGEVVSHEISQKQYDKFMAVDDYQRQRMMSRIFSEVDMKTRPEMRNSFNPLAALAAGLEVAREATYVGADIAHGVEHIKHPHMAPDVYQEAHGTGRIYAKPGVDSPQDIASRAFEAGFNQATHGHGLGR